jgi:hypothetical protein
MTPSSVSTLNTRKARSSKIFPDQGSKAAPLVRPFPFQGD